METVSESKPEPREAPGEGLGTSEEAPPPASGPEAGRDDTAAEVASALPVPVEVAPQKRSLWRRLIGRGEPRPVDAEAFQDLVKSRLDGITLRLEALDHAVGRTESLFEERVGRLDQLEGRLEALGEIAERADEAQAAARRAAEAAERAARAAQLVALVAGVAALAGAAALFFHVR